MNRLRLFLDLDRTLFRTSEFDREKWPLVASLFPSVSAAGELARQPDFFVHNGQSYYYDFSAHLKDLGLPADRVYQGVRDSYLADGRLEHDGVAELVAWAKTVGDVQILTYGEDKYQRLKAELCQPSLRDLPVYTTDGTKGDFFRENFIGEVVWMIDDKPIGDELPENVKFIQVCLPGEKISEPTGVYNWKVVRSLAAVRQEIIANHKNSKRVAK